MSSVRTLPAGIFCCLLHTHTLTLLPTPPHPAQVLRLECAAEFGEPVDLQAFPDYTEDIKTPMDLGTVKVGGSARCGIGMLVWMGG